MAVNPICEVRDGSGSFQPTLNGVNVTPGNTVSIRLASTTDVTNWYLQITGTDELTTPPTLVGVNPITNKVTSPATIVTFTMPASAGRALLLSSMVEGSGGPVQTTFGIYSLTAHGRRVGAVGEQRETSANYGWSTILNPVLRSGASVLYYNDNLALPHLGVNTIQAALDAVKAGGGGGFTPGGDLGGSSTSQLVIGVQNRTITNVGSSGQSLTAYGTDSASFGNGPVGIACDGTYLWSGQRTGGHVWKIAPNGSWSAPITDIDLTPYNIGTIRQIQYSSAYNLVFVAGSSVIVAISTLTDTVVGLVAMSDECWAIYPGPVLLWLSDAGTVGTMDIATMLAAYPLTVSYTPVDTTFPSTSARNYDNDPSVNTWVAGGPYVLRCDAVGMTWTGFDFNFYTSANATTVLYAYGSVWIGSDAGHLYRFNPLTFPANPVADITLGVTNPAYLTSDGIYLYVWAANGNVAIVDPGSNTLAGVVNDGSASESFTQAVWESAGARFWAAAWDSLNQTGSFRAYTPGTPLGTFVQNIPQFTGDLHVHWEQAFSPSGDLSGTRLMQRVSSIQGIPSPNPSGAALDTVIGAVTANVAPFTTPRSVVTDGTYLYIAESSDTSPSGTTIVRKVRPSGQDLFLEAEIDLGTIVSFEAVLDLALNPAGTLLFAACGVVNNVAIIHTSDMTIAGWAHTGDPVRSVCATADYLYSATNTGVSGLITKHLIQNCLKRNPGEVDPTTQIVLANTRAIRYGGGKLWITRDASYALSRLDLDTLVTEDSENYGVSGWGRDCVYALGSVWLTTDRGDVVRVDPDTLGATATISAPTDLIDNSTSKIEVGLNDSDGSWIYATSVDDPYIRIIDPDTNTLLGTLTINSDTDSSYGGIAGVSDYLYFGGYLTSRGTGGVANIGYYDPQDTSKGLAKFFKLDYVPGLPNGVIDDQFLKYKSTEFDVLSPRCLVYDGTYLYVTNSSDTTLYLGGYIYKLLPVGSELVMVDYLKIPRATGLYARDIAVDSKYIYAVTQGGDGVIVIIDKVTMLIVGYAGGILGTPISIASSDNGLFYVSCSDSAYIYKFDVNTCIRATGYGTPIQSVDALTGGSYQLRYWNDALWVTSGTHTWTPGPYTAAKKIDPVSFAVLGTTSDLSSGRMYTSTLYAFGSIWVAIMGEVSSTVLRVDPDDPSSFTSITVMAAAIMGLCIGPDEIGNPNWVYFAGLDGKWGAINPATDTVQFNTSGVTGQFYESAVQAGLYVFFGGFQATTTAVLGIAAAQGDRSIALASYRPLNAAIYSNVDQIQGLTFSNEVYTTSEVLTTTRSDSEYFWNLNGAGWSNDHLWIADYTTYSMPLYKVDPRDWSRPVLTLDLMSVAPFGATSAPLVQAQGDYLLIHWWHQPNIHIVDTRTGTIVGIGEFSDNIYATCWDPTSNRVWVVNDGELYYFELAALLAAYPSSVTGNRLAAFSGTPVDYITADGTYVWVPATTRYIHQISLLGVVSSFDDADYTFYSAISMSGGYTWVSGYSDGTTDILLGFDGATFPTIEDTIALESPFYGPIAANQFIFGFDSGNIIQITPASGSVYAQATSLTVMSLAWSGSTVWVSGGGYSPEVAYLVPTVTGLFGHYTGFLGSLHLTWKSLGGDLSGDISNALVTGLQHYPVANTTPSNGQILAWNGCTNQWEPTTLATSVELPEATFSRVGEVYDGSYKDGLAPSAGQALRVKGNSSTGPMGMFFDNRTAIGPDNGGPLVWTCRSQSGDVVLVDTSVSRARTIPLTTAIAGHNSFNPHLITTDGTHLWIGGGKTIFKVSMSDERVLKTIYVSSSAQIYGLAYASLPVLGDRIIAAVSTYTNQVILVNPTTGITASQAITGISDGICYGVYYVGGYLYWFGRTRVYKVDPNTWTAVSSVAYGVTRASEKRITYYNGYLFFIAVGSNAIVFRVDTATMALSTLTLLVTSTTGITFDTATPAIWVSAYGGVEAGFIRISNPLGSMATSLLVTIPSTDIACDVLFDPVALRLWGVCDGTSSNGAYIGYWLPSDEGVTTALRINGVLEWFSPVTIGGDLSGTASAPTVSQIQTRPVSATAPITEDALIWSGSAWAPTPARQPMIGATWNNPGRPYIQKAEGVTLAASATYTMANISGAGYMTQFFMSINGSDTAGRRNTRMKVYVDGESSPSIDVMLVDLGCARGVEAAGGATTPQAMFMSRYVGYSSFAFGFGVGYYLFIDIPFTTSLRVDITNGSSANSIILGGYIQYFIKSGVNWGRYKKLHGISINGTSVAPYAEQTLVDIAGKGLVHGAYLHFQGGDSNYNYLEGNVQVYIDGESTASCAYDSTEDYFLYPWYFWIANNTRNVVTDFVGCTRKDDSAQVGAYRWHIRDPLAFDTNLKFSWTNGEVIAQPVLTNTVINGVVWYYTDS